MDICALVGINIRKLRHLHGWSQEELAFSAKMERSYLSQIENGQRNMTLLMLVDIATALKVKPIDLLKAR